jgi:hypothetical protein
MQLFHLQYIGWLSVGWRHVATLRDIAVIGSAASFSPLLKKSVLLLRYNFQRSNGINATHLIFFLGNKWRMDGREVGVGTQWGGNEGAVRETRRQWHSGGMDSEVVRQ